MNSKYFKNNFKMTLNLFEDQVKVNKYKEEQRTVSLVYPKWNKSIFFNVSKTFVAGCDSKKVVVEVIPTMNYWTTIYVNKEKQFSGMMYGYDLMEHILGAETSEYEQEFGGTYDAINERNTTKK